MEDIVLKWRGCNLPATRALFTSKQFRFWPPWRTSYTSLSDKSHVTSLLSTILRQDFCLSFPFLASSSKRSFQTSIMSAVRGNCSFSVLTILNLFLVVSWFINFGASKVSENILDITRRQSFVNRNFSSFFLFLLSIHRLSFQLFVFYGVLNRESTRKIIFSAGDTSFLYFTVFLRIRWSDKIA